MHSQTQRHRAQTEIKIGKIRHALSLAGIRKKKRLRMPPDYDDKAATIIGLVAPYTMINHERLFALIQASRYIARNGIEGAIVECGVWRGGAIAAANLALQEHGVKRPLYLFDTFEGMPAPTDLDKRPSGRPAMEQFEATRTGADTSDWCYASLEEVQHNLRYLGVDEEDTHFIKGKVEETVPEKAPDGPIALLRLDTDWYQSTKHGLQHLFPKLVSGGVLIIDDYGDWPGARQAVDEYLDAHKIPILLTRVKGSVIAVKR
ncbi:MAG: class I SAM-dependent methyltransferase [Alphaproteobacteria bacterium]|nr:class I SAM-dependent methyltransferase [Alphaproteobacteria bacterium]